MDLKEPGNALFLLGVTNNEMGGSHYNLVTGREVGEVPKVDLDLAPRLFRKLHDAMSKGLIRACHDLSEGGIAVALAEMAFAGEVGADVALKGTGTHADDAVLLYAESATRFIVEVRPANISAFQACLGADVPTSQLGQTVREPRFRIAGAAGEWIVWANLADLKEAWQRPLRW
jgi:phosphoribosylformylglycinamidine synthase